MNNTLPGKRKFVITKLVIEGASTRKKNRTTADLLSRVFSDLCKEDLTYYLAEELTKKHLNLVDIRFRDVTP